LLEGLSLRCLCGSLSRVDPASGERPESAPGADHDDVDAAGVLPAEAIADRQCPAGGPVRSGDHARACDGRILSFSTARFNQRMTFPIAEAPQPPGPAAPRPSS